MVNGLERSEVVFLVDIDKWWRCVRVFWSTND